jgi:hypothetical protein
MLSQMRKVPGLSRFYQLSLSQQVILADCVDRDDQQIDLPAASAHADFLRRNGWLIEEVCIRVGMRSFCIPSAKWTELKHIKEQILTDAMKRELQMFRYTVRTC